MVRIGNLELFQNSASTIIGTPTNHGLPIGQGSGNPLIWTAAPTNGQLLIGSTGSDPVLGTLQAGAGVAISNGPGTITISAATSGVAWQTITTSQLLAVNNGYICTAGGALTLTLPTGALGDEITVILDGSTSWTITPNVGASIRLGKDLFSSQLISTEQGDAVRLLCQSATRWNVISTMGNLITV